MISRTKKTCKNIKFQLKLYSLNKKSDSLILTLNMHNSAENEPIFKILVSYESLFHKKYNGTTNILDACVIRLLYLPKQPKTPYVLLNMAVIPLCIGS